MTLFCQVKQSAAHSTSASLLRDCPGCFIIKQFAVWLFHYQRLLLLSSSLGHQPAPMYISQCIWLERQCHVNTVLSTASGYYVNYGCSNVVFWTYVCSSPAFAYNVLHLFYSYSDKWLSVKLNVFAQLLCYVIRQLIQKVKTNASPWAHYQTIYD